MSVNSRGLSFGLLVGLSAMVACGESDPPTCGPQRATVISVIDGDTVILESGERIRYWFVDTPELSGSDGAECFADEARQLNLQLVDGREVNLEYPPIEQGCRDRYDRLLALVSVDGVSLNRTLVERGYARVESFGDEHPILGELEYLEAEAQSQNKGLWGACK